MKEWKNHQRNEDKEVEILDFNGKGSGNRKMKKRQITQQNTKKKKQKSRNKEFAIVTYAFLALFIGMTGYFAYFVQVKSSDFVNNPYNARLERLEQYAIRGRILAADGTVLAETQLDEAGNETRYYPYGNVFAHAVGYASNGMAGVELDANYHLLTSNTFIVNRLANQVIDKKNPGDDVVTTLDVSLQNACYNAMGAYDGAVICMEPSTGKILAMVSKPDYDPNYIASNWNSYVSEDSDSTVLLNRATQGLYAPGSTFKMITLLSYLQQKGDEGYQFDCNGSYEYDDYEMHCYNGRAHGQQNLLEAFGNSCNSAFSQIGLELDLASYNKLCDKLLFNRKLPTKLKTTAKSRMDLPQDSSSALVMQTAIGQGKTMVSPLHMAMIAGAIANDGKLMEPYIIDHSQNDAGTTVKQFVKESFGQLLSVEDAKALQEYMRYVVTNGTASPLNSTLYEAYGKTGTAEFSSDKNKDHSWFVGFAKNTDGKEIAIAVVMEGVDSGNSYAVPASKMILDSYFGVE
ncbi:MAG: penicillin-binding protein 2 [Lachnospiraceae bacterium]|nr:penicillin-binding protein 2 [Lachnospiraceae bacterium]